MCTIEEAKGFHGGSAGETAVYGNVLLSGMVCDGEKAVPGICELYFHGIDTYGTDRPPDLKQKEPDCKVVFVGPCAAKKLEASRKSCPQLCGFCPDL